MGISEWDKGKGMMESSYRWDTALKEIGKHFGEMEMDRKTWVVEALGEVPSLWMVVCTVGSLPW